MNRVYRDWDEVVEKRLTDNPDEARLYLLEAMQEYFNDNNLSTFLVALRHVVNSQGGIGLIAERSGLDRRHLYRVLSDNGNPHFSTIITVLRALNIKVDRLGELRV
ncbi:MAG: DNA-binding protein [Calditrichota bacterium]